MTIVIDKEYAEILRELAAENKVSLEKLVETLIRQEDSKRHVVWDRKTREFVRRPCGLKDCQEAPAGDIIPAD